MDRCDRIAAKVVQGKVGRYDVIDFINNRVVKNPGRVE